MIDSPQKLVKEYLARAKSHLARDEIPASVSAAINALNHYKNAKVHGKEKMELEVLVQDFVGELNKHDAVRDYFYSKKKYTTPFIKYASGNESKLMAKFEAMERDFKAADERADEKALEEREEKKAEMLRKGQQYLDEGDTKRGKGMLRRVGEAFGRDKGVLRDIGKRFFGAQLYSEAGEFFERAIDFDFKDSEAYSMAVKSFMQVNDYERAENIFLMALKQFGAHPKTYLSMSKLYLEWKKFDKAYDFARQAHEADPDLEEASTIMDRVGSRIFTRR